jgi:ketosteroid isomerase-like protein
VSAADATARQAARADDPRVQRIIERFETLAEADLPQLAALYTPDARFKDPFNEVQGTAAITAIFAHMFRNLDAPRFEIRDVVVQGRQCFLSWDFRFRMRRWRRDEQCIRGGSHLVLAEDGRIAVHRDYWDAAEELYEKLPAVGALMRWLKRRAAS